MSNAAIPDDVASRAPVSSPVPSRVHVLASGCLLVAVLLYAVCMLDVRAQVLGIFEGQFWTLPLLTQVVMDMPMGVIVGLPMALALVILVKEYAPWSRLLKHVTDMVLIVLILGVAIVMYAALWWPVQSVSTSMASVP